MNEVKVEEENLILNELSLVSITHNYQYKLALVFDWISKCSLFYDE
jgi:hypothetical protein